MCPGTTFGDVSAISKRKAKALFSATYWQSNFTMWSCVDCFFHEHMLSLFCFSLLIIIFGHGPGLFQINKYHLINFKRLQIKFLLIVFWWQLAPYIAVSSLWLKKPWEKLQKERVSFWKYFHFCTYEIGLRIWQIQEQENILSPKAVFCWAKEVKYFCVKEKYPLRTMQSKHQKSKGTVSSGY